MSHKKDASRRNISALARELAPQAIAKIGELLNSQDERVRLSAAEHVLDRAIGKPVAMTADVTDRLDEFTDEQLDAAIADIQNRIGIAAKADTEAPTPPVTH